MSFLGRVGTAFASAFGFGASARPAPNTKPNGGDGIQSYGGFLPSGERDPRLQAGQKWVTYADAKNVAIIATGLRYRANLLSGTKWHAQPNPLGGHDADRGAEIVTSGLLEARLRRPWPAVVRKASLYTVDGFSLHEWSIARRAHDGVIGFSDLAHRPPHTIERWNKPSEQDPWDLVGQRTRGGETFTIPRGRLFYCWDDTLTDSPDGIGLMRHVIALVHRLTFLEGLESVAYESDLRGMPMGRAPLRQLAAELGTDDEDKIQAHLDRKTQHIRKALTDVFKTPDKLPWLLLDSSTYTGVDQNMISTVQKWAFELLKGETNGLPDVNVVIKRLQLEIARVLGIEFALIGDGSGTYGTHADKTSMFATSLQATLTEIAAFATNDLARVLVGLNGLDPETCTPTLIAEPISTEAVESTCRALQLLAQSALRDDDPAINVIRARLNLPDAPQPSPAAMGVLGLGGRPRPGAPTELPPDLGGPPDPAAGETDIPVDDLGTEHREAA